MAFQDVMIYLNDIGVADVLLPFILIFTLVFAILQKTRILGEDKGIPRKNLNIVVALVMGLGVVIPHVMNTYPPGADIVVIMNTALPNVGIVIVAILALLLILGMFGNTLNLTASPVGGWAVIIAVVSIAYIFGRAAGWFGGPTWLGFLDNPETQTMIVIVLVFAVVVWFVTKEDSKEQKDQRGISENFRKLLGGGKVGSE